MFFSGPGRARRNGQPHQQKRMTIPSLPVLDPTAAAIDVGSEQLHVSVAGGPPKVFGPTTGQLHELRDLGAELGYFTLKDKASGTC